MLHGLYEDPVTTVSRNKARKARQEKAKAEDRAAGARQLRRRQRSI